MSWKINKKIKFITKIKLNNLIKNNNEVKLNTDRIYIIITIYKNI